MNCRLCHARQFTSRFYLGNLVYTGLFPGAGDDVPSGILALVECKDCGLVQLDRSFPREALFTPAYGYASRLNAAMVQHLRKTANRLAPIEGPVLDIGSNDGTLLSFFPGRRRVGIDPIAPKFPYPAEVTTVADFFPSPRLPNIRFGLVTTIAMLYDLDDPVTFVRAIHNVLLPKGRWYTEQAYLPAMLQSAAFDTVCHEHVTYFTLRTFGRLAHAAGFGVEAFGFNDVNGGSFWALSAPGALHSPDFEAACATETCDWPAFRNRVQQAKHDLLDFLRTHRGQVLGYGASTKGNVLLQAWGINARLLPRIGEVNPEKFGRYTPGSHIPIVPEAETRDAPYLLVLPWHFRDAIVAKERDYLEKGGALVFPLPRFEVVRASAPAAGGERA